MRFGEGNNCEEEHEAIYELLEGFNSIHGTSTSLETPAIEENSIDSMDVAIARLRRSDSDALRVHGVQRVVAPAVSSSIPSHRDFGTCLDPEQEDLGDCDDVSVGSTGVEQFSSDVGSVNPPLRSPNSATGATHAVDVASTRVAGDLGVSSGASEDDVDECRTQSSADATAIATRNDTPNVRAPFTGDEDSVGSPSGMNDADTPVLFAEDEIENGVMENYRRTLMESTSNSVVYGGDGGSINPLAAKFLEQLDEAIFPIRDDGWFREGLRKNRETKHILFHHPNMLSHTYLQTHPDGVLHILPGWTHDLFISDIAYSFKPKSRQFNTVVPFLGALMCTVRTFHCVGVLVCKQCSPEFRREGTHIAVDPRDKNVIASLEALSPASEARKKVIGMFLCLEAKKKSKKGFCRAEVRLSPTGPFVQCRGAPTVVASTKQPGTFFTGCTGYSSDQRLSPKVDGQGKRNLHHGSRLTIEGSMLQLYRKLLNGEEHVGSADTTPCTFVRGKRKGKKTCPRHGCKLVEISCKKYPDDKNSCHTMCTIEPEGYHEDTPDDKKVLFVSCIGEHVHPPPPPAEATAMKLRIFDYLCSKQKWPSLAQLRSAVETVLDKMEDTEDGPIKVFDRTLTVPRSVLQRRLRMLRPPVPKLAVEVGELALMAADENNPYVQGMQIVDEKYVFFLGIPQLILFASRRMSFAGDATYKTVSEFNRSTADGRWYLYNIVVQASEDRLNGKSIVVMRALMTGLSRDVYSAIWTHFFKSIIRASNELRGEMSSNVGCLQVPYIDIAPTLAERTCTVTSITMDFDAAEIHGCVDALRRMCGGAAAMHLKGMFIGCSVHLQRDLLRRSRLEDIQRSSGMSSFELKTMYDEFRYAVSAQEAESSFEKIRIFDAGWVKWVENVVQNTHATRQRQRPKKEGKRVD